MQQYGIGTGTSRAGYGNSPVVLDVESKAAQFFETQSAIYYVSGYMGNAMLLQGLTSQYDVILMDEESHYSVTDGARIAQKPLVSFAHRDANDLQQKLKQQCKNGQRPLVFCDGITPTSGEVAPLNDYRQVLSNYSHAVLCVDDAYATGVIGHKGQGSFEYYDIDTHGEQQLQYYSTGTLSKALGGHGGIITGSHAL